MLDLQFANADLAAHESEELPNVFIARRWFLALLEVLEETFVDFAEAWKRRCLANSNPSCVETIALNVKLGCDDVSILGYAFERTTAREGMRPHDTPVETTGVDADLSACAASGSSDALVIEGHPLGLVGEAKIAFVE